MGPFWRSIPSTRDPVVTNGVALVANAAASALLGFAFWMVAARRFNADALGIGAAVVSAATLAALVGKAGFDAAIIRYGPASDRKALRTLLLHASIATMGLTGLVAIAMLGLSTIGIAALDPLLNPAFAVGFVLLALATGAGWVADALFIAEQRAWRVFLRNLAFNGVKLVVPLAIAYEWGGRAVPLAWMVGLAASLAVALWLVPRTLAAHVPQGVPPTRRAFGYSMRNYALNLSEFLPGLILPLIVLQLLGPAENARFFLAWTAATVAFLASKAIAQSTFAQLVRDTEAPAPLAKGLALSAALLLPGALILHLGAPTLLALFGAHYVGAAELLRLLALSIPFVIATNLHLSDLKAQDRGWELTMLPVASLLALLVLLPLTLPAMGIAGVGVAWLSVQVAVGLYAFARLVARIWRKTNVQPRTRLRRHPHEG